MTSALKSLGFRLILIDEEVIPLLFQLGQAPLIHDFSGEGPVFVRGNPGAFADLVEKSGGGVFPRASDAQAGDVLTSVRRGHDSSLNLALRRVGVSPTNVRTEVLHLKHVGDRDVLVDRSEQYALPWESYVARKGCHLKLVAYSMETCSFGCVYCFANYEWARPTTVLLDAPERLSKDIQSPATRTAIQDGEPIYVGSLTDMCSPESLLFGLFQRCLVGLKDIRVFTVTKSPLVSREDVVAAIVSHGRTKIVFTYTNLYGFERHLPYDAHYFPAEALSRLVAAGVDVVLLYKPIVPGVNDRPDLVERTIAQAREVGIREVSIGFLQRDERVAASMTAQAPRASEYFNRVASTQIGDEYYPEAQYRDRVGQMVRAICDSYGLRLSFCQAHLGQREADLETSYCVCRPQRWTLDDDVRPPA